MNMLYDLLIWGGVFIGCICIFWGAMCRFYHKSDWKIILPSAYAVLSIVVMAIIYPDREVAQMEFGFFGIGFLALPASSLVPILRGWVFVPVFDFIELDYCSGKVFSIGLSLMILGCSQYFIMGKMVQKIVERIGKRPKKPFNN